SRSAMESPAICTQERPDSCTAWEIPGREKGARHRAPFPQLWVSSGLAAAETRLTEEQERTTDCQRQPGEAELDGGPGTGAGQAAADAIGAATTGTARRSRSATGGMRRSSGRDAVGVLVADRQRAAATTTAGAAGRATATTTIG